MVKCGNAGFEDCEVFKITLKATHSYSPKPPLYISPVKPLIFANGVAKNQITQMGDQMWLWKFFFDDGRPDETVLVPLLYGISWLSPIDFDQDGTATRFICAVEIEEDKMALSIGVGQQDFVMEGEGQTLLGLGSIGEIMTVLFGDDPKFDQKCRARGLDPDTVRRSMIK